MAFTELGSRAKRLFRDIIHDPDLVMLIPMNEDAGKIYDRCTKNIINSTAQTGITAYGVAMGHFKGLQFTAATPSYLGFGSPASLQFGSSLPFSLLAMINPNVSAQGHICGTRDNGFDKGDWAWLMTTGRVPQLMLHGQTSGRALVSSSTALTNGTATMIGATADGTGAASGIKHYKDGAAPGNTTVTDTVVGPGVTTRVFNVGVCSATAPSVGEGINANALGFIAIFNAVKTAEDYRRWAWLGGLL